MCSLAKMAGISTSKGPVFHRDRTGLILVAPTVLRLLPALPSLEPTFDLKRAEHHHGRDLDPLFGLCQCFTKPVSVNDA